MFTAAETAPKVVKYNSNIFVFDHKQFSEITIVHKHKRV